MELWFSEPHTPDVKLSIRVDRQLYSGESGFQRIDVYESPEFGRFQGLSILYAFLRFMHLVYKIFRRYLESYGR